METFTVVFTDASGKPYTATVHASDEAMAIEILKGLYPQGVDFRIV